MMANTITGDKIQDPGHRIFAPSEATPVSSRSSSPLGGEALPNALQPDEDNDNLEKAFARLSVHNNALVEVNVKKQIIEKQRIELHGQACDLLRNYKSIEKELAEDATVYSRVWHKKMAEDICTKLPQELRDMIYDQLIYPYRHIEVQRNNDSDWHKKDISFPLKLPFMNLDFVNHQFATEIAKRVLSIATFEVRSLSLAAWLLRSNIFGCGLLTRDYIHSLRVHIFPDDQTEDVITRFPTIELKQGGNIDKILNVTYKTGFKLDFMLVAAPWHRAKPLLLSLATIVYRCHRKGFAVRVFHYPNPAAYSNVPERLKVRELTGLYCKDDVEGCRARIEGIDDMGNVGVLMKLSDTFE